MAALTKEQLERQDLVDGKIHEAMEAAANKKLDWSIEAIGELRDALEVLLREKYGAELDYPEDTEHCRKCGSHFFTHNDDGSCPDDDCNSIAEGGETMPMEPISNIRIYCSKHAPKLKGFEGDPVSLIGRYVKVGFDADHEGVAVEHMWVEVIGVTQDGVITGKLANDPVFVDGLHCGDAISLTVADIEAVLKGGA